MADEPVAPESSESASLSLHDSFAAAEKELGTTGDEVTASDAEAPEQSEEAAEPGASSEQVPSDPEYLEWVKSVQGNTNDDGTVNLDRVSKQAFELNKQNQQLARETAAIKQLLQNPAVASAVSAAISGKQPEAPKQEAEPPKEEGWPDQGNLSDQQYLDLILERKAKSVMDKLLNERVQPLQQSLSMVQKVAVNNANLEAHNKLREEFGLQDPSNDASGYVIDTLLPEINQQVATAAQGIGRSFEDVFAELALSGRLVDVYRQQAQSMLFPSVQEKLRERDSKILENKKRTRVSPKNGSPTNLAANRKQPGSVQEAARQAMEELETQGHKFTEI